MRVNGVWGVVGSYCGFNVCIFVCPSRFGVWWEVIVVIWLYACIFVCPSHYLGLHLGNTWMNFDETWLQRISKFKLLCRGRCCNDPRRKEILAF